MGDNFGGDFLAFLLIVFGSGAMAWGLVTLIVELVN